MSNKHVSWAFKQSFEKKNNGPVEHFAFLKNVCYQYFNFELRVTYCFFYELLLGPQPTSLECAEPFSKRARFGSLPNFLQNIGKRVWSAVACSLYPCLALPLLDSHVRKAVETATVDYPWPFPQKRQPEQSHTDTQMHQKQAIAPSVVGSTTLVPFHHRHLPLEVPREHLQKPGSWRIACLLGCYKRHVVLPVN